jgi:hypothetical protein
MVLIAKRLKVFGRAGLAAPKLLAKAGRSAKGLRPSAYVSG